MSKNKIFYFICVFVAILSILIYWIPSTVNNPQDNYAEFLIDLNNQFVLGMYNFANLQEDLDGENGNEKISEEMSNIVIEQNELVKKLKETAPNEENEDYMEIAENMREMYLFYLQGEIYILEQTYSIPAERDSSLLGMGNALTNTMGDAILKLPDKINSIRNTEISPNYRYEDVGEGENNES